MPLTILILRLSGLVWMFVCALRFNLSSPISFSFLILHSLFSLAFVGLNPKKKAFSSTYHYSCSSIFFPLRVPFFFSSLKSELYLTGFFFLPINFFSSPLLTITSLCHSFFFIPAILLCVCAPPLRSSFFSLFMIFSFQHTFSHHHTLILFPSLTPDALQHHITSFTFLYVYVARLTKRAVWDCALGLLSMNK